MLQRGQRRFIDDAARVHGAERGAMSGESHTLFRQEFGLRLVVFVVESSTSESSCNND